MAAFFHDMAEVIIHLGLHKTATTTLQQQFFPYCRDLNYLRGTDAIKGFVHQATVKDPLYFDAPDWRARTAPHLRADLPNLVSEEALSGPLYSGVGKRALDHRSPVIANLKAVFPDARIIIVLRRQDGLACSYYRQYLKVGGTESLKQFYSLEGPNTPIIPFDRFLYLPYIDRLVQSFPAGVLILIFEEFVVNPYRFLKQLTNFIGINMPNVELRSSNQTRLGSTGMEISRIINRFFRSQLNPGGLLPGIPRFRDGRTVWVSPVSLIHSRWPFKGTVAAKSDLFQIGYRVLELAAEDNRCLDSKYGLGLDEYGYYR